MTEKLQQKSKEEIAKLPKINQEAINSVDWGRITEEIGKKSLLGEFEINDFQIETLLVLVGLENLDMYTANVENIGMSRSGAENMAKETFEKVFTPIANKMEESVKNSMSSKNPKWDQRINFILSGGDYSNFIDSN